MIKKVTFLFLLLLLPIAIFSLLRLYGKNEFRVPVYHLEEQKNTATECNPPHTFPYQISLESQLRLEGITLISFMHELTQAQRREVDFQLENFLSTFKKDGLTWLSVYMNKDSSLYDSKVIQLDEDAYQKEKKCYYLSEAYNLILVDDKRRIRGYYQDVSLKEFDRLVVEIEILFNEG